MGTHTFSDKNGPCMGCLKDGIITVWRKDMPKSEFSFAVTASEAKSALFSFGNPNWVLITIAKMGLCRSCALTPTAYSATHVTRELLDKEKEHAS